jgi:F420H2-dehydrogenase, beta subunit
MDKICDKDICTGCGLCASICPKNSIKMVTIGKLGHLYPQIDQEKCVDCGLCKKKCPSLNTPIQTAPITAYAAIAKDNEEYHSSTSGGAASVFSRYIIEKGGVVYGCAVVEDDDVVDIRHIRVDMIDELYRLKGSKYVQSRITEIIPLLKEDIKNGKEVLFVGTPCQCAAIKNLYNKTPDNLYLVDLICHGVPSLSLLKRHIRNVLPNKQINKLSFREGNEYKLSLNVNTESAYCKSMLTDRFSDFYYDTFIDGVTFRESCYTCRYAKPYRCSDITIGDFWGLNKDAVQDFPEHSKGTSVLLPITDKGVDLIDATKTKLYIIERIVDEAVKGNHQLQHPINKGWRTKMFRYLAKSLRLETAYSISIWDRIVRNSLRKLTKK